MYPGECVDSTLRDDFWDATGAGLRCGAAFLARGACCMRAGCGLGGGVAVKPPLAEACAPPDAPDARPWAADTAAAPPPFMTRLDVVVRVVVTCPRPLLAPAAPTSFCHCEYLTIRVPVPPLAEAACAAAPLLVVVVVVTTRRTTRLPPPLDTSVVLVLVCTMVTQGLNRGAEAVLAAAMHVAGLARATCVTA